MGNQFIIDWYFNIKHTHWGSKVITTKRKNLLKAVQTCGCDTISPGKPTCWSTKRDKTLT